MQTLRAVQTGLGKPDSVSQGLLRTTCEHCGARFPLGIRRGKARRWCDDTCRWLARKASQANVQRVGLLPDGDLELLIGLKVLAGLTEDLLRKVERRP